MALKVFLLSDAFAGFPPDASALPNAEVFAAAPTRDGVPDTAALADADAIVVIGQLTRADHARELAGAVQLALETGGTATLLYPVGLDGGDVYFLIDLFQVSGNHMPTGQKVIANHPAFRRYFARHGVARTVFSDLPSGAETLGSISEGSAAMCVPVGEGWLYVLPYHTADLQQSHGLVIANALEAIRSHRTLDVEVVPDYLSGLRLPGEQEILESIIELERELDSQRAEAARLERYRLLLGPLSGDRLEDLVIDALNTILESTNARVDDREDVGGEDFWLVDEDGAELALGEAKGINSNVRLANVSQVEQHRGEQERGTDDLPGLLVVNTFRNSEGLDERRTPVSDAAIRQAARLNVLILRTVDLHLLLSQALEGRQVGAEFLGALAKGGGWLEVSEGTLTLHQD